MRSIMQTLSHCLGIKGINEGSRPHLDERHLDHLVHVCVRLLEAAVDHGVHQLRHRMRLPTLKKAFSGLGSSTIDRCFMRCRKRGFDKRGRTCLSLVLRHAPSSTSSRPNRRKASSAFSAAPVNGPLASVDFTTWVNNASRRRQREIPTTKKSTT